MLCCTPIIQIEPSDQTSVLHQQLLSLVVAAVAVALTNVMLFAVQQNLLLMLPLKAVAAPWTESGMSESS